MRWLAVVLLLPFGITAWLLVVMLWLGLWTAGHAAVAVREQSLPSLSRALDGAARTVGVASWIASGWGALTPVVPALEQSAEAGRALDAVATAGRQVAPALPDALGGDGARSYLFATLNDAELFGSGGAPLNALAVRLVDARASIPISGSVSMGLNPGNAPYAWEVLGGLPWYRPGAKYPFANSNFHPDFTVSGANMYRAWNALGHEPVAGVVAVDVAAVAAVLTAIGPLETQAYGEVSADNVMRVLLVDAYRRYPDWDVEANLARQGANAELQARLIDELRDWRTALRAARALWELAPSRHVQVYFADPRLESAAASLGVAGTLSVPDGDVLGVFLQSAPSKIAIFQRQRIVRRVTIRADGSAAVEQRVTFTNDIPEGLGGDVHAHRGYLALTYRQRVAFRIPAPAQQPEVAVLDGRELVAPAATGPYPDSAGAMVLWQGQDIGPGESSATSVTYELPPGTFTAHDGLAYTLTADPQPMANPPIVELSVTFPTGSSPEGAEVGWSVSGTTAHWSGALDRPICVGVHA